jgi:hypothetical protein
MVQSCFLSSLYFLSILFFVRISICLFFSFTALLSVYSFLYPYFFLLILRVSDKISTIENDIPTFQERKKERQKPIFFREVPNLVSIQMYKIQIFWTQKNLRLFGFHLNRNLKLEAWNFSTHSFSQNKNWWLKWIMVVLKINQLSWQLHWTDIAHTIEW